jgi:hypothetical protein
MQYLTYEEYQEIGGTLDLTAFKRNIDRACAIVDSRTQNRLQSVYEISQRVKACIRDLVEYLNSSFSSGRTITSKSQSAGGVSESESYETSEKTNANDISSIIYDYLSTETDDCGTPLLYRGAMR